MIYPDNFEQKIGIDSIRQYIIEKCWSTLGEEFVFQMSFSANYEIIEKSLKETDEFVQIIKNKEDFPSDFFIDTRNSLHRIEDDITIWFSEEEILNLSNSLQTIYDIVHFLQNQKANTEKIKYPFLALKAEKIKLFPAIIDKANSILDKSSCQIKDNASRRLYDIRKDKAEAIKTVTRSMQGAIREAQKAGFIRQDVQISMRDGHMVIPVDAANKRKIKGRIHDGSGSGKTVFIEPEAVVEASNRLRELEADERREVVKILIDFADMVRPHLSDIYHSYSFMGEIDFIQAKASFAIRINAIKPTIENKPHIEWKGAIHPLLNIQLMQQRKQAHPLDIVLNDENRLLIVSGANAGGKSLCLKTTALLQYMLQCGLLIPIQESSKAGVFERIFIDIGDGQSIENSLSTYTSHLANMKYFVANSNNRTLILIDEFGSGTEPLIGGAIAETLLDRFNRKQSFGIITTHFQNLKHFAYKTKGIINGAMLYDTEKMQPLYRLSIGNPGSSFAIEVAKKIGLPEDIIIDSSAKIGNDFINMDNLLQSIAKDKIYWEDKRKELDKVQKTIAGKATLSEKKDTPRSDAIIKDGDSVRIKGQTVVGTVLNMQNKQAVVVSFGLIKSIVALDRLELV